MPNPTQRRGRDPLAAIFEGVCCWPDCGLPVGEVEAPLCTEHLLRAWRIVQLTGEQAFGPEFARRVPPEPVPKGDGLVYFVRLGNRVKIGWTSNLAGRMAAVPHDEILHTQPGTMRDEKRCHAAFAHLREVGEWFRAEPDLLTFIDSLRAGNTPPTAPGS